MPSSPYNHFVYPTPFGPVTVEARGQKVSAVTLGRRTLRGDLRASEATNRCATQLQGYFAGRRRLFSVDVALEGSDFQNRVWHAVGSIPFGRTETCASIAERIGRPDSFRAVGSACKANPVAIIIPTHRVVGASGYTAGADRDARMRAALLKFEQQVLEDRDS